jgi:hypothetical protein
MVHLENHGILWYNPSWSSSSKFPTAPSNGAPEPLRIPHQNYHTCQHLLSSLILSIQPREIAIENQNSRRQKHQRRHNKINPR